MKQVPQNEMDVLLRKLSRVERSGAEETPSAHLDPDELSAYAENVLPAAARAKYTEHLADCSRCRRIVTDLAPTTVAIAPKKELESSAWNRFFSKLTAPLFLRYAVPSLAAVLILVMGFFVVNRRSGEMVANKQSSQPERVSVASSKQDQGSGSATSPPAQVVSVPQDQRPAKNVSAAPKPEATPASKAVDDERTQDAAAKREEVARADATRQSAEPPPAAPSVAAGRVAGERELAKSADAAEKKKAPSANEPQAVKEEVRKLSDVDAAASAPKPSAGAARRPRSSTVGGLTATDSISARDKQNKDDSETRRVAGRNFRKVNSVWIDTGYDSRATTDLSRGSEQFRALVADEPSIRTIAEQLDGEIIVVWKGRAYRIR